MPFMKGYERFLGRGLGLSCIAALLHSAPARADDASAAETAAARALAVDGLRLAQSGDCAEATPKLERAEKLYHSAVVASRLGECYVSLGRLVEGTEILRKVLREPQPSEPTPALAKALERAQRTLDAAKPRIAGITIKVASVQDMTVKVDGNSVPPALVDTEIPTDPGEHAVEVTAPGFLRSSTRVSLGEGERKSVTVTLARDPDAAVAAAPATTPPAAKSEREAASREPVRASSSPPAAPSAADRPNHTAAYVALGIGGAGLVTGGVLGFLTMRRHSDLEEQCPDRMCGPGQRSDLDAAKQLGNFSTVAFAVGGVGVVVGTVLLLTASSHDADRADAQKSRIAAFSRPRLAIGPTEIHLSADF